MRRLLFCGILWLSSLAVSEACGILTSVYTGPRPPIQYLNVFAFTGSVVNASCDATGVSLYKPLTNGFAMRFSIHPWTMPRSETIHVMDEVETGWITNLTSWQQETVLYQTVAQARAYEYAIYLSTDGSGYEYCGNGHGFDWQDSISLSVDGSTQPIVNGAFYTGQDISVVRVSHFIRSDVNATVLATNIMTYRIAPSKPVQLRHQIQWTHPVLINQDYVNMFMVDPALGPFRGGGSGFSSSMDLSPSDGLFGADARQYLLYMYWGNYAVAQYFTNPDTVSSWSWLGLNASPIHGVWKVPDYRKLYLSRVQSYQIQPVSSGEVWDRIVYWDFVRSDNISSLFP